MQLTFQKSRSPDRYPSPCNERPGARILDSDPHYWHGSDMAKKTETKKRKAADTTERRQATIYFPVGLLKRAKKYGIDTDRELSDIVTTAVAKYLDRLGAPE